MVTYAIKVAGGDIGNKCERTGSSVHRGKEVVWDKRRRILVPQHVDEDSYR